MADPEIPILRKKLLDQEKLLISLERFQRLAEVPLPAGAYADLPMPMKEEQPTMEMVTEIHQQLSDRLRTKETLEESLRAEVLQCERQRAYIGVLEEAVFARAISLHFPYSLQDFINLPLTIQDIEEKKSASMRLQMDIDRMEIHEKGLEAAVDALKPLETDMRTWREEITANEADSEGMREKAGRLREEIETLQGYLGEKEMLDSDFRRISAENDSLQGRFDQLSARTQSLSSKHQSLARQSSDLPYYRTQFTALSLENRDLRSDFTDISQRISDQQVTVSTLETLTKETENLRSESDRQAQTLCIEKGSFEDTLEKMTGNLCDFQAKLTDKSNEMSKIANLVSLRDAEIAEITGRREFLTSEIGRIRAETDALHAALQQLRACASREQSSLALLQDQYACEHSSLQTQRESFIIELRDTRKRISGLQSDLAVVREATNGADIALRNETTLRCQITEMQKAIIDARREIVELSQAKTVLRFRLLDASR